MKPDQKRHILKTITWRITATIVTFLLVWILGGDIKLALHIGFIEIFVKMLAYYGHERFWYKFIKMKK